MLDLKRIDLFRITHIENIPHILQHGITHSTSPNANPVYKPIGDNSLIGARGSFILSNGRRLGDYIPFYFASRMPMLFVIQNGYNMVRAIPPQEIVYCISSVQRIMENNLDFIFTDGHAVNIFSTQYEAPDIERIESILDWKAIRAKYWKVENDLDIKRRKEAEFLVLGDIPFSALRGFLVCNESARLRLLTFGVEEASVHIKPDAYF